MSHGNTRLQDLWNTNSATMKVIVYGHRTQQTAIQHEQRVLTKGGAKLLNIATTSTGGAGARSTATKAKISKSHTGKKHSEATKAKMAASHRGKKHSIETKAKIASTLKGKGK